MNAHALYFIIKFYVKIDISIGVHTMLGMTSDHKGKQLIYIFDFLLTS